MKTELYMNNAAIWYNKTSEIVRQVGHLSEFPPIAEFFRTDGQAGWQRHDELILDVCSFLQEHINPKGKEIQNN